MSDVRVSYEDRLATYSLGDFGAAPIDFDTLDSVACHEMLHVLLAELLHLTAAGATPEHLASAEHRVVILLEKLLTAK
jgi:hypothetical protein